MRCGSGNSMRGPRWEQTIMDIRKSDTAVVFIDPQNDVLSEKGANWGAVGASVTENGTIENIDRIFKDERI